MFRNNPEAIVDGRIGTRGRIEYHFEAFGAVAILCIEMKLGVGNEEERLKAIAQVIAECNGCDLNNAQGAFSLPILCILSDGLTFEFFKFERDGSGPSFFRGCFPGDPEGLQRGLKLPDPQTTDTTLPFVLQLRGICETIFDTMLSAYISALYACRDRSALARKQKRPSLDGWDQALKSAEDALATFRKAETQRKDGNVDSADMSVSEGLRLLHESTGAVSTVYTSKLFMTFWDEEQVKKA